MLVHLKLHVFKRNTSNFNQPSFIPRERNCYYKPPYHTLLTALEVSNKVHFVNLNL